MYGFIRQGNADLTNLNHRFATKNETRSPPPPPHGVLPKLWSTPPQTFMIFLYPARVIFDCVIRKHPVANGDCCWVRDKIVNGIKLDGTPVHIS